MKYRPDFPDQVLSLEHGRGFCGNYFDWYNNDHHHSGLGFLTPAQVHHGLAANVLLQRQAVLERAHAAHPERFPRGAPTVVAPPSAVLDQPAPAHCRRPRLGAGARRRDQVILTRSSRATRMS